MTPTPDSSPAARMLPEVYRELQVLATAHMSTERIDHTLQPTALVHEVYLKLVARDGVTDQAHFKALAATAIRQVLVDHARRRGRFKRQGGRSRVLIESVEPTELPPTDAIEIDECVTKLTRVHGRPGEVAALRLFGGLSLEEMAAHLSVSRKTVCEDWAFARAWLRRELGDGDA